MATIPVITFPYAEIVNQTQKLKQIHQELIEELAAIDREGAQHASDTI